MPECTMSEASEQVNSRLDAAQRLLRAGYRQILPIIPPNAPMPEGTDKKTLGARGKIPGFLKRGLWYPLRGWQNFRVNPQNVPNWDVAGANIGLAMGDDFAALDVDVTNPKLAILMRQFVQDEGIEAPVRVGLAPKFLLPFHVKGKLPCKTRSHRMELDGDAQLIEVLGTGRQAVISGCHPGGFEYIWDQDIVALGAMGLPEIEPADLHNIAERMAQVLLDNGCVPAKGSRIGVGGGSANSSKEGALARNPEALCEAFSLLPNDYGRADWIRLGQALKAGVGDAHEAEGLAAWEEWSAKGEAHTNPQTPAKEWGTMMPDGSIGAGTIIWELDRRGVDLPEDLRSRLIKRAGKDEFQVIWLDDAQRARQEAARASNRATQNATTGTDLSSTDKGAFGPLGVQSVSDFIDSTQPRKSIVKPLGWYRQTVNTVTANPNGGKTALALEVAFALALGEAFQGRQLEPMPVLYLAGENYSDVRARVVLMCIERGVDPKYVPVDIRKGGFSFADHAEKVLFYTSQKDYGLIVVDTLAAHFGGDSENDNTQMQRYFDSFGKVANGPGIPAVVVLAHPSAETAKLEPQRRLLEMRPRGASASWGAIDSNLNVAVLSGGVVQAHLQKRRSKPVPDVYFRLKPMSDPTVVDGDGDIEESVRAEPITQGQAQFAVDDLGTRILKEIKKDAAASVRKIMDALAAGGKTVSRGTVQNTLEDLHEDGMIDVIGENRNLRRLLTQAGQALLEEEI